MSWEQYIPPAPYEHDQLVYPEGPEDAEVLIVGEAPGDEEIRKAIEAARMGQPPSTPFRGAAGWELNKLLTETRLNRSECRISNVSLELPKGKDFRTFFYDRLTKPIRYIPKQRLLNWHKCLEEQVIECDPNVIIAMGNEPLFALTGHKGITKRRGSILTASTGHKLIPTIHPAGVLRQWRWRQIVQFDLARAAYESEFGYIIHPEHEYIIEPNFDTAFNFLDRVLTEKPVVSVDLETRANHIACIGIADTPVRAICIPFMRLKGHYWTDRNEALLLSMIFRMLVDPEIPIIGQNIMVYDAAYFWEEWGVRMQGLDMDTLHAHHVHNIEGPVAHGLHYLTSIYTDPVMPYYKEEGKVWEKTYGEKQFWTYCCKDCVATYQAREGITEDLRTDRRLWFYHDYVKPLSWVLQDLQLTGLRVDEDRKSSMLLENQTQIGRLQHILDSALRLASDGDITTLNVKSNPQMKHFLYEWLELPYQYTGVGRNRRITTDEDALAELKEKCKPRNLPFDYIWRIRELRKENEFLEVETHDGRLHTTLKASGTETGRLASAEDAFGRGTNLQNVKNRLRAIFIPDPGYKLWEVDGSQAEARVVAVLAQQWDLVELFERGDIDVHWENAKRIFDLDRALPYVESNIEHYRMRYLAKRIIHASNYGMSWYKFKQLLLTDAGISMSKSEAEQLLETYHVLYPNIRGVYHDGVISQLRKNRELTTPFGRVRIFHDRWPDRDTGELFRKAFAYIPQSTVGDLINRALLEFDGWCKTTMGGVRVLMQVHDSILYQSVPSMELAARAKMQELMEKPIEFDRPKHSLVIPAEFKCGMNWAYYHKDDNPMGIKEAA